MLKAGRAYRLVTDQLGSVRAVIDSQDGTVAQQIDYDAFGKVTADSAPRFQPLGLPAGSMTKTPS